MPDPATLLLLAGLADPRIEKARSLLPVKRRAPIVAVDSLKEVKEYANPSTSVKNVNGMASRARNVTYITREGKPWRSKDPRRLAAILEHEQAHQEGADEEGAQRVELDMLKRLGADEDYTKRLAAQIQGLWPKSQ